MTHKIFNQNLLLKDGECFYLQSVVPDALASIYFTTLLQLIPWKSDTLFIYGKQIITRRKMAWYGDDPFPYHYSKTTRIALPWTETLLAIKSRIEEISGETFNCCLLNLYHNGTEGMGWHSDDEKEMKKGGTIASLSLGAERIFRFKHKSEPIKTELLLGHGSLLLMRGETQQYWLHQLPVARKVKDLRINLTFRTFVTSIE